MYTCMLNSGGGVEADLTVTALENCEGTGAHNPRIDGLSCV